MWKIRAAKEIREIIESDKLSIAILKEIPPFRVRKKIKVRSMGGGGTHTRITNQPAYLRCHDNFLINNNNDYTTFKNEYWTDEVKDDSDYTDKTNYIFMVGFRLKKPQLTRSVGGHQSAEFSIASTSKISALAELECSINERR